MKEGRLLVISGPSGTGKGTICKELFEDMENIVFSVSMTTRKPREGEVDGRNYYFVSRENFQRKISEDGFLEYAEVFDNYYGTPKKAVMDQLSLGHDVILEIDIQGAMQVKEAYPEAISIFVLPPSMEELEKRIKSRGTENEDCLNLRLNEAINEMNFAKKYDYTVVNDDLKEAVNRVKGIIRTEYLK